MQAERQGTFVPERMTLSVENVLADALPFGWRISAIYGGLHRAAREGRHQNEAAETGRVAEPVSGRCHHHEVSGVHVSLPENRAAGLRRYYDRICAKKTVHRAEGSEDVVAGLSEFGNFL